MNNLFNEKLLIEKAKEIDLSKNNLIERRKVLNKWISMLDNKILENSNEISLQGEFIGDIFSIVLNAINKTSGENEWNLQRESSTKIDGQKADGVLGFFDVNSKEDIRAVIELKSPNTNLDTRQKRRGDNRTPVEQAFGYAPKYGKNCLWVIVSNYKEIRLYKANDMTEYQVFFLDKLREDLEFKKFIYIMSFVALIGNEKHKAKTLELSEEYNKAQEEIKKKFYKEYKDVRLKVFEDIRLNNKNISEELLLEKTQKLLDRFLFICFAEDKNLLPFNSYSRLVEKGERIDDIFESFKMFCRHIDKGSTKYDITPYNGGLFKEDEILDDLIINNKIFLELKKLSDYDFDSELNENVLGHIFEQSISDLEELKIEILGDLVNEKTGKRKNDGIYYTPKYICKYIVENTIKNWLDDKRKELGEDKLPVLTDKDYVSNINSKKKKYTANYEKHINFWRKYRECLRNITILDPACGSGAFLLTAFEFLHNHAKYVNQKIVDLTGTYEMFDDLNKDILINNIFGVDLNKESIEITKLSLWLKTANKGKPLTTLDENIKCGNSLISDESISQMKFFDWEKEFPNVFKDGGFDIIIGNPPYGSKVNKIEDEYIKNRNKDIVVRMTDMFMFFVNQSINLLNSNGYLSFIIPDVFLYQKDNEKLRRKIIENHSLKTVINVGNVFEDVERPCCIFILNKKFEKNSIIDVGTFKKSNKIPLENISMEELDQKTCIELPNAIIPTNNIKKYSLFTKLNKLSKLEYFIDKNGINRGVSPDLKEAFILSEQEIRENKIESIIIKKTITGGVDLKRFIINEDVDKSLLYITKDTNSDLILNSISYIEKFLDKITCNEVKQGKHPFYTLHRPRNEEIFLSEKKICGVITSDKIIVAIDENKIYPTDGIYLFTLEDKNLTEFFTVLLNSKFLTFIYQMFSMEEGRNLSQVKPILLKELPICNFTSDQVELLSIFYKQQKELNIELNKKIKLFHKRILSNFKILDISKKIEKFYTLEFLDLLKELKKYKVKLSLLEQDEWEDYFNLYKKECIILINNIKALDDEIDKNIYKMYNLTKEEIILIEK
ncbi:MAG: Eco57I restriction-modification methylase domain-containing protein [Cetobacterium sp.]